MLAVRSRTERLLLLLSSQLCKVQTRSQPPVQSCCYSSDDGSQQTLHRSLDVAYASLVHQLGLTERFFQRGGFGDLNVVNFHRDIDSIVGESWPPPHFDDVQGIHWKRTKSNNWNGSVRMYEGSFKTPCVGSAYDALPEASRQAHVKWVVPESSSSSSPPPTMVHLAATGDHGFSRREAILAVPLAKSHGIASLILESPYYGLRKPWYQQGAKLKQVSDLLLLGRATIEESLYMLDWVRKSEGGETKVGVSGLSMGGVHSCMVASLYPHAVALVPLLAPRSAAAAYCRGALYHATGWKTLMEDVLRREEELKRVVQRESRPGVRIAAARKTSSDIEDTESIQKKSVSILEAILEAYTDITRFPLPVRPDAAVIVGATEDAYVSKTSIMEMHSFLRGSELRWVGGGHVTSFLLHHSAFRKAIRDALLEKL